MSWIYTRKKGHRVGDVFSDLRRFSATLVLLRSTLDQRLSMPAIAFKWRCPKGCKAWLCWHHPLHKAAQSFLQDFLWDCGVWHFSGGRGGFFGEDSLTDPLFLVTYELTVPIGTLQRISPYPRRNCKSDTLTYNMKWKDEKTVPFFSVTDIHGLSIISSVFLCPAQLREGFQRRHKILMMNQILLLFLMIKRWVCSFYHNYII